MVVFRPETDERTRQRMRASFSNRAVLEVFRLGNPAHKEAVIAEMKKAKLPYGKGGHRTSVQNAITRGLLEYVSNNTLWLTEAGQQRLWDLYAAEAADILLDREVQNTTANQAVLKDRILGILKDGSALTASVEIYLRQQGIHATYMDTLQALMDLQAEDLVFYNDGYWSLPISQNREIAVSVDETEETTPEVIWEVAKRLSREMPGHTPLEVLSLAVEIKNLLA